jgi:mannose-6-phosphate isomerase
MTQYLLRCCNVVTRNPSIPCIKCGELHPFAEEVDKHDRVVVLPNNFSKDKLTEERPWGSFNVLLDVRGVKIKKLVVKPNQRLSLQLHKRRDEHWFVVEGEGILTVGNSSTPIKANDSVDITRYTVHSVECVSEVSLVIVEIQTGTCSEDDIIRLEDDYGRV